MILVIAFTWGISTRKITSTNFELCDVVSLFHTHFQLGWKEIARCSFSLFLWSIRERCLTSGRYSTWFILLQIHIIYPWQSYICVLLQNPDSFLTRSSISQTFSEILQLFQMTYSKNVSTTIFTNKSIAEHVCRIKDNWYFLFGNSAV